ncbi:MAG: MATE family efflux transporter [Clostridia bacterium]|nr:MATE family efflux transporter [Clostridia bacterium]
MTKGTPWKSILTFTVPMLIGNIAQQLYNTVDCIVVGREVGNNALAAVGSAGPLLNLLLVLFIGISTGANTMVSQYFGQKNRKNLSYAIGNCITVTAIACVILLFAVTPLLRPLLEMMNTSTDLIDGTTDYTILDACEDYLKISLIGIAGLAFYNILSNVIRGMGDSISALIYLLVAAAINVVLDIIFVKYFGMAVAGVALATVIAQIISSILCLIKLSKMRENFDFSLKYLKPRSLFVKTIIKLGLPAGLTQAIFSSAMIIVQSLINSFGPAFVAANVIIMRVDGFAMMPNFSFGTALTTYAGQNVGAKLYDRVVKGARQGTLMAVACSTFMTIAIIAGGKTLMSLFVQQGDAAGEDVVAMSYRLMLILAVGYIAMAVTQSLSGIMRGAGDTMTPMWISLITTVAVRIPIAYGIAYITGGGVIENGAKECIQISLLCSWVLGAILTALFYRIGKWKTKAIE